MRSRIAVIVLALTPSLALAHGGGLDKNGCHTDRKTGRYHCHGSPAASNVGSSGTSTPPPASPPPQTLMSQPATQPVSTVVVDGVATERQLLLTAQLLLSTLGYSPGKHDGLLSTETISAIRQFQADRSLQQDGKLSGSLLVRLAEQVALQAKL